MAIEHQASADAGADGNEQHVLRAAGIAERVLTKGGHAGVVQQRNGPVRMRSKRLGDVEAGPLRGKVGQENNGARVAIDEAGQADADGQDFARVLKTEIVKQAASSLRSLGRPFLGKGGDHSFGDDVAVRIGDDRCDLGAAEIDARKQARSSVLHEVDPPRRSDTWGPTTISGDTGGWCVSRWTTGIGWRRTECSYTPGNGCSQVKAGAAEHSPPQRECGMLPLLSF